MFEYNISKNASSKEFKKVCLNIEKAFPNIVKHELLEDMDGSEIQVYEVDGKKIKVYNDYEVDAVYIDSEVKLDNVA